MKAWELEENEVYFINSDKNDGKYKKVNGVLYWYSVLDYDWVEDRQSYNFVSKLEFISESDYIDWYEVEIGSDIKVRDDDNEDWEHGYKFAGKMFDKLFAFPCGDNINDDFDALYSWKYVKLDK